MKAVFTFLFSALISFGWAQTTSTDTIYRALTVVQADSLIDANPANPDFVIIDLRTPSDYSANHLLNSININYYDANFSTQIAALDHNKMYLLYCLAGSRSTQTYNMMQTQNFREVYNMLGGINAWITGGYPTSTTTDIISVSSTAKEFNLWPNPTNQFITINCDAKGQAMLSVTDASGKLVFSKESITPSETIDLSQWMKGTYIFTLSNGEKRSSKMIVKL